MKPHLAVSNGYPMLNGVQTVFFTANNPLETPVSNFMCYLKGQRSEMTDIYISHISLFQNSPLERRNLCPES